MNRFPNSAKRLYVDVVVRTFFLGRAELAALNAWETLPFQYRRRLIDIVDQKIQMMDPFAMLLDPISINGWPVDRLDKFKLNASYVEAIFSFAQTVFP